MPLQYSNQQAPNPNAYPVELPQQPLSTMPAKATSKKQKPIAKKGCRCFGAFVSRKVSIILLVFIFLALGVTATVCYFLFASKTSENNDNGYYTTTLAGSGAQGSADGRGLAATFNSPLGLSAYSNGSLIVADSLNSKIRKISVLGQVTTFSQAKVDGRPTCIVRRFGVTYFSTSTQIFKLETNGILSVYAGSGVAGNLNGGTSVATFSDVRGLAFDSSGNLFVSDYGSNSIRKIYSYGYVEFFATIDQPRGLAFDISDNLFVISANGIWQITIGGNYRVAGSSNSGYSDIKPGLFNNPEAITSDRASSIIYVADTGNNMVKSLLIVRFEEFI